jgi:nicotinamide mononucleotide adenylyltransferase
MCELGVETTSMWLMVDPWEAGQDSYQRTAVVLQHFEEEINGGESGGVRSKNGACATSNGRRLLRLLA